MEIGKENEGERKDGEENSSSVSSAELHKDIVNLLDFIERLNNEGVQIALDMDRIEELALELTFVSAFCHLYYFLTFVPPFSEAGVRLPRLSLPRHPRSGYEPGRPLYYFFSEGCDANIMSCISNKIHDLVQSLFHQNGEDMLLKLKYHDVPHLLENIKSYTGSHSYAEPSVIMTEDNLVELFDAILMYLQYLPKWCSELIIPSMTQYELLQNVFGNLRYFHELKVNGVSRVNSKLANLLVAVIPVELEIMHICSTNLKASPDILREYLIHLQQNMVNAITRSTSACSIHVMIEFLLIILTDVPKDVIRHDKLFVLLARVGALIREVAILVCNLEENSMDEENMNEISCASRDLLENIELLKEDLKHVFLKAPANSSQLCFPMSDGLLFMTLLLRNLNDLLNSNADSVALIKEEIGRVKEDLELIRSFFEKVEQELNRDLWAHVLDVAYEAEHSINSILARDQGLFQFIFLLPDTVEKIKLVKKVVQEKISKKTSFEEETEWIIRKLTSRPAEIDVISIVGMPGLGKTTLKIFNQVIGLKGSFNENSIDNDVADKLRKYLFRKRCLIVLDDLWDTATWEVALHGKCYSDPLDLRLLRLEESWELLEKRIFGEERCPDELKDVGDKIAQKCGGLPLVLDLIGGVISRKEKKEALWLEVLNNLSSFIFKDE
ncbi:hypothetical protein P3S67_027634 [Capsicum chacoense]